MKNIEDEDMRPIQRAAVGGLFALWLAPLSAMAQSQSSNSSSNCSNGRCTRVDSYVVEDRYGRRGWVREDRWREGRGARESRGWGWVAPEWRQPRRARDDDDDD